MYARERRWTLLALLLLSSAGCYSRSRAPRGVLPAESATYRSVHGSWVRVRIQQDVGPQRTGELIAVHADTIFVLDTTGLARIDRAFVRDLRVERFRPGGAGPLLALGVLATASHGIALILSAPVWIIVGGFAARSANNVYRVDFSVSEIDDARIYARFPQGLPPGVDGAALGPPFGEVPADTVR